MTTRRKLAVVALAAALLLSGYLGGRYAQPARVEVRETVKVKTEVVERVVTKVQTVTVAAAETKKNVVVERIWMTAPDGATNVKEVTRDLSTEVTKSETRAAAQTEVVKASASTLESSRTVVTENRPSWSVGVQPGIDLVRALAEGAGLKAGVLGATVERRLVGGLWAGAWANTRGAGGISVRLTF